MIHALLFILSWAALNMLWWGMWKHDWDRAWDITYWEAAAVFCYAWLYGGTP